MKPRGWVLLFAALCLAAAGAWFFLGQSDRTSLQGPLGQEGAVGTVLLIPGYGGDPDPLTAIATGLSNAGATVTMVNIKDGRGDINLYGRQVAELAAASTPPVTLVGYSQGGLIARVAAAEQPQVIGRVITIATPHSGTAVAGLASRFAADECGPACRQMAPGSDFLANLPTADGTRRWLALFSGSDEVVRPADSAALDGASALDVAALCGVPFTHSGVIADPVTVRAVVDFALYGTVLDECPGG